MKNYRYTLLFALIILATACEDFLDRDPLDEISTDSYWKTASDLENYVVQFYQELPSHNDVGAGMPLEDEGSDNLIQAVTNEVMNGERGITTGDWTDEWKNIRGINLFFDNFRNVEDDLSSYQQYLGEAHFFRAWFYFQLVEKYGDVPWYSSALSTDSEELMNPRDPRTLVIDSILVDLDKAVDLLNTINSAGNSTITKEAALALKSRIALYEGAWQKYHAGTEFATSGADPDKYFQECVGAAEELMNGSSYTKGLYDDYYELFGLDNMSAVDEVLLYRVANEEESLGSNVQYYTTNATDAMSITWWLVSSYLDKDGIPYDYQEVASGNQGNDFLVKIAEDCDPRLKATVWIPGDLRVASTAAYFDKPFINQGGEFLCGTGFQVKKFSNPYSDAAGRDWGGYSETGYIIFRYAEVLLNYAEAKYELDGTVAYDQLNLLRKRAGMPDFTVNPQSSDPNLLDYGYTISDELYEIRRERRVELALEGKREDDYRRWAAHALFYQKRPLGYPFDPSEFPDYDPPVNGNNLIDYFLSQLPNGYQFRPEQDYLDDIPQDELTLNPNLAQNPGW